MKKKTGSNKEQLRSKDERKNIGAKSITRKKKKEGISLIFQNLSISCHSTYVAQTFATNVLFMKMETKRYESFRPQFILTQIEGADSRQIHRGLELPKKKKNLEDKGGGKNL